MTRVQVVVQGAEEFKWSFPLSQDRNIPQERAEDWVQYIVTYIMGMLLFCGTHHVMRLNVIYGKVKRKTLRVCGSPKHLPPLPRVSTVVLHYQCDGCRVVDCGALVNIWWTPSHVAVYAVLHKGKQPDSSVPCGVLICRYSYTSPWLEYGQQSIITPIVKPYIRTHEYVKDTLN